MKTRLLLIVHVCLLILAARAAEKIPAEAFFKEFEYEQVQLSPSGRYLAAIVPRFGRKNLAVVDLDKSEMKMLTDYKQHDVETFWWIGDGRLLYMSSHRAVDENWDTVAWHGINRDGSRYKHLIESVHDQIKKLKNSVNLAPKLNMITPLRTLPGSTEHILVTRVTYDSVSTVDDFSHRVVERLNVFTGNLTQAASNPGDVVAWWSDAKGDVRLAEALKENKITLRWRPATNEAWQVLTNYDAIDRTLSPMGFTAGGDKILAAMPATNMVSAIFEYDPRSKTKGKLIWQSDTVEPEDLIWSRGGDRLLGVRHEPDRPMTEWVDEDARRAQSIVDKSLPTTINELVSLSLDANRAIYLARSDRDPGAYYLHDRKENQLSLIARRTDAIKPSEMAQMEVLKFKARDGLPLVGYLTLPAGSNGKNLPLVLNPHGGPWARDYWGFNPEVQFLASRGYAVMQVNFRGSTGYGLNFLKAGFKDWGKSMQNDLTDTVKLLVDEGVADPKRVAIYGASYGGYATMAGLTFTPELYRCGINYVGVNDVVSLLQHDRVNLPSDSQTFLKQAVGNLARDKAKLAEISPINHVKKIRVPVLMAYGEIDPRVHIAQGRALAAELRKHGKKYEFIVEPKEGHGFRDLKAQVRFYNKVESFLAENMK